MNVTLLKRSMAGINQATTRQFSVAHNVKSQFEAAYKTKMEGLAKVPKKM